MAKILGIEFAPLWLPLERRLQTFAVLQWTLSFLLLGMACLTFMVYLAFTGLYIIPALYAIWYIYDYRTPQRGGRKWEWVRSWRLWEHLRDYFPITLVKTAPLDPSKNYILGFHPHGIMCDGAFVNFGTNATKFHEMFPGMRPVLMTIPYQFFFPLHREYFMTTGSCSCSADSMKWWLTKEGTGNALALVVGGAFEALEARPGSLTLNVCRRQGFIRMALEYGADIVPVFSFGENDIFEQVDNPEGSRLRRFQLLVRQFCGFSAPIFHARGVFNYTFGIIPYRRPIYTVVGAPIPVEQVDNPSDDQVDELLKTYTEALVQLFESQKLKYGQKESDHLTIT